ncbi:MAG: hypothetical protein RDV48_16640 [Candidatus Eremiobacteraeota bacterium]|nr:hypothetical protein [Candidatus Eremiobacteraeota bacterium]
MNSTRICFRSFVLLALCAGLLLVVPSCAKTPSPQDALRNFVNALVNKQWESVWNGMSFSSQKDYEEKVFKPFKANFAATPEDKKQIKHPQLGVSVQDILEMSPKEFFMLNMEKTTVRNDVLAVLNPESLKVEKVTVEGDMARIKLEGNNPVVTMKKENGEWRVCLF